jgi:hypothetical protein
VSTFDDPNREAVGLDPVWTGADTPTAPPPDGGDGFDPADHTVAEVWDYIDAHPDERDAVIAAEHAGKDRAGIVDA